MSSLRKDNLPELLRALKLAGQKSVMVGVPEDEASREPEDGEQSEMNNPTLAHIHELGSPLANIPARPFLAPGIKNARKKIDGHLQKALLSLLDGDTQKYDKQLHMAGITAQNSCRRVINEGEGFQPLADSTLAQRRARGRTGTKPLIDTAQLRNSITYVVKEK